MKDLNKNDILISRRFVLGYCPRVLLYILVVLLLSWLDAVLTIYLLGLGATEVNPVMAFFLSYGPVVFMLAKSGLTILFVPVMLFGATRLSKRHNHILEHLFYFLVCAFGIVIFWELYLIFFGLR